MPDEIITYIPHYCDLYGDDLALVPAMALNNGQVINIPIPTAICTEHRTFAKTRSCGHLDKGEFPINVTGKVQYVGNIEALTAYLNVRQYMPYNRIHEFYGQIMGFDIVSLTSLVLAALKYKREASFVY